MRVSVTRFERSLGPMQDDVEYAIEMFDTIERCVKDYKEAWRMDYFEALDRIIWASVPRRQMFGMNDKTAEYDMINIVATFNIIWGE